MKVGDLVKVSNNGFTAIGYIRQVLMKGAYAVDYFVIHKNNCDTSVMSTGGIWSKRYIQVLSEDKKCP